MLEWFKLNLLHGWLNGLSNVAREAAFLKDGIGGCRLLTTLRSRREHGLVIPYSKKAEKLGLRRPAARAGQAPNAVAPF